MPMPTTRLGRFLYYKKRQLARRQRAERRAKGITPGKKSSHHVTSRRIDRTGWSKQEPREYPLHPKGEGMTPAEWVAEGWTPPTHKRWGVLGLNDHNPPSLFDLGHPRVSKIGYHARRVLSMPRLKHLPRLPYRYPISSLTKVDFYPYPVYPSGRPSHWSTLPDPVED